MEYSKLVNKVTARLIAPIIKQVRFPENWMFLKLDYLHLKRMYDFNIKTYPTTNKFSPYVLILVYFVSDYSYAVGFI